MGLKEVREVYGGRFPFYFEDLRPRDRSALPHGKLYPYRTAQWCWINDFPGVAARELQNGLSVEFNAALPLHSDRLAPRGFPQWLVEAKIENCSSLAAALLRRLTRRRSDLRTNHFAGDNDFHAPIFLATCRRVVICHWGTHAESRCRD